MGNNRILYVQYTNPAHYPPLEHSSRLLAERNWQVLFLGIDAATPRQLDFKPHPGIEVHRLKHCRPGPLQKLHYLWFCLWTLLWAWRWRPRWIYASDHLSSIPALLLRALTGARLVYHEHDYPCRNIEQASSFFRLMLQARRLVAARAELVVVPGEERLKAYVQDAGQPRQTACVFNCSRREEVLDVRKGDKDGFVVHYHGTLVPVRVPFALIRALVLLPDKVTLQIVGFSTVGHPNHVSELKQLAADLNVSHRIRFVGAVNRSSLGAYCETADLGLCLMPKTTEDINERHSTTASNKPFDYLACSLPLLVSDLPDWTAMYVLPGFGLACDPESAESIAEAIRWCLDRPAETRAMGQRGRQKIVDDWHYEKQFAPVLLVLEAHA